MGVVLAMHICDEVNVFGFGADKDGNWNHYWESFGSHFGTGQHGGGQETCNLAIRPFSARVAELKVFEIFPQQESFMDSSPDRCRTCAVVGNSVNLLRSHYGPLIDLHDVIMRCVTEDDDPWFTKRFDASLKTFLTRNNTLSERDFRWWKNLQFGNKAFPSYRMAEMKVFEIFPQQESFMDSSPDRCRTCAVVGNSVNLLGSHYGPLIDFHDVIMRFNTARTVGYEGDVGNKTTLHIMYPESAVDLDDHTHLILFPFKIRDLEWLVSAFTTKSVKMTNKGLKSTVKANQGLVGFK
ncbi:unnamed protein product [Gadus morhua 'NCC']